MPNINHAAKKHDSYTSLLSIHLSVVFGSPSRACAGSGICRMIPSSHSEYYVAGCHKTHAVLLWEKRQTNFHLLIDQEEINGKQRQEWLECGTFLMEEDFIFPLWLSHIFGVQIMVEKGAYHIKFDNKKSQFVLNIPCKPIDLNLKYYKEQKDIQLLA